MTPLPAEALPPECMAGTFYSHGEVALAITILGLLFAIYALARAFQFLREQADAKRTKTTPPSRHAQKAWLLITWTLLPPAWLFCEHIFLYRAYGKPACFEFFTHAQQIVSTGWLATLALLTFLYFGSEVLGRET
jgi:hypothetical protein